MRTSRRPVSHAIMWLILARAPRPDAPYWRGRRALALIDALAWPAAWIGLVIHLPQAAGIVGPVVVTAALLGALTRTYHALWQNYRYRFTTWRWGCIAAGVLAIGLVFKAVMS